MRDHHITLYIIQVSDKNDFHLYEREDVHVHNAQHVSLESTRVLLIDINLMISESQKGLTLLMN